MPRNSPVRRACAVSLAAAAVALPAGVCARAGAAGAAPTVTASASAYILSASHNPTVTIKAHVVDPAGAEDVDALWGVAGTAHPASADFTLASGTATDGTWTVVLPTVACNPVWTIDVEEFEEGSSVENAKTSLSVLTVSDLPDTTPPDSPINVSGPTPVVIGKPSRPYNDGTTTAAPGAGVEFSSTLTDFAECGQVSSGTKSVTVTAAPQSNPAAAVTAHLHLAIDPTNPSAFGLHWAGTLKLPATAAPGPWSFHAVAADNAGNVNSNVFTIGSLTVSP